MRNFAYGNAGDIGGAVARMGAGASAIAGSTEILNWMRLGIMQPAEVVDVTGLEELRGISREGDALVIGALSTLNEVGGSDLVREHAAVLSEASLKAASAQIRNRATLGGNVLQKTRCGYFRAEAPMPWGCNKREAGTGCPAREGLNDQHAIFGWSDACVATQPSDPAVALAAMGATVNVLGPQGGRQVAMRDFHVTPAEADPQTETQLRPGELIVSYAIPIEDGGRSAYLKVRERESYAYATVSAAAWLRMDGDRIGAARVALGSVAAKPWRLDEAEAALVGRPLEKAALMEPVEAAMRAARPLEHNAYKVTIAKNAAVRAMMMAGGAA